MLCTTTLGSTERFFSVLWVSNLGAFSRRKRRRRHLRHKESGRYSLLVLGAPAPALLCKLSQPRLISLHCVSCVPCWPRSPPPPPPQFNNIGIIVYCGVSFVNKFAAVALACVIFSIIAIYVGVFTNMHGNDKLL